MEDIIKKYKNQDLCNTKKGKAIYMSAFAAFLINYRSIISIN